MIGYVVEYRIPGWIRVNDTPVTEAQLIVQHLTPSTEYEFRVAAVNEAGMSDFSQVLSKIMTVGKPGIPDLPEVVSVTGTSVCLQWKAPTTNIEAPITQYIVVFRTLDKAENITVKGDTISYTIRKKLQAHTKYRFAVMAVNKKGEGPLSDMTEEVTTFSGTLNIYHPAA